MRITRWSALILVMLLVVPILPHVSVLVSAGRPIFASNVLAVGDQRNYNQVPRDLAVDGNGRIYMSYQTYLGDIISTIWLVHSDDGGVTWSRSFRIDDVLRDGNTSNDDSKQSFPRLAVASNNTLYAVWADWRDKTFTQQIRIAWSTDGENFSRSIRIDGVKDEPIMHGSRPDIAINDAGRIFVTWLDRNVSGSYWNIWSAYSDNGGVTWSTMKRINTDSPHVRQHEWVGCAMQGNDVYVTWHDNREDSQYRPYIAISHDGGATFLPEKAVSDDLEQTNSRQWPSPAVDDVGNLYITWRDKRTGSDEIWFAKSTDKGATISQNKRLTVAPENVDDWYPVTAARGNGVVSVAWQRRVPSVETKDEGEIFFLNSSNGGSSWAEILRVDDTDRYWNDISVQELPVIAYDLAGRAICAWSDGREEYTYSKDAYFSRHSGDLTGPNHRPMFMDMGFVGNFTFNRNIGSTSSPFLFYCNYSDEDNDVPVTGYPRLHIFNDSAGTDPVLSTPLVLEKRFPGDFDNIDGVRYEAKVVIPVKGNVYYSIEVVEERDPDPYISPVLPGPYIDGEPPELTVTYPQPFTWVTKETVRCTVRVEDRQGGHVNPQTIKVRRSVQGLENMEAGVLVKSFSKLDNNTYEALADVKLEQGIENFIIFEAKDRVNNGPGLSPPINVWVDSLPPEHTNVRPNKLQLYERVNCSIDWVDHIPGTTNLLSSGVNASTIRYNYRTTTTPSQEWKVPEGIIPIKDTFRSYVHLDFENNGVYNYIRWKATDNLGQETVTNEFKVHVRVPANYPPAFIGSVYPKAIYSRTPHIYWDDAFDEEGDVLYYRVMLMRGDLPLTKWIEVGERTFYDVSDDNAFETPGFYRIIVNVTDHKGGYDLHTHDFRILDSGVPPPEEVPPSGPYRTRDPGSFRLEWGMSPSELEMNVSYLLRIGSSDWRGDILDWTEAGDDPQFNASEMDLGIGVYSVQFMAENNGNFSRVTQTTLKVNDYELVEDHPASVKAVRGKGSAITIQLTNMATFSDNVTVQIRGELVEQRWAYLSKTNQKKASYLLSSQKNLTIPASTKVLITIFPDGDAPKKNYQVHVTVTSEDGLTDLEELNITVKVTDRPPEGTGNEITDTLYKLITDLLPFLRPIHPNLLVGVFLALAAILILAIAAFGIQVIRRSKAKEDPYAEQRKIYRDLYGSEPTQEQLESMSKESSVVDDVMSGVKEGAEDKGPGKRAYDESFLGSEGQRPPEGDKELKGAIPPVPGTSDEGPTLDPEGLDDEEAEEDWGIGKNGPKVGPARPGPSGKKR